MLRLGQIMALVATIAMVILSILLIANIVDSTAAGGFFVVALIIQLSGVAISRKHKK